MNNIIISTNGITKKFTIPIKDEKINFFDSIKNFFIRKNKTIYALKNLNLKVKKGEIFGYIGPNGAGKTTTIKILTGILTPSEGNVEVLNFSPQKNRYNYSYNIGVVMGQRSLLWYNIPVIESFKIYRDIYEITQNDFKRRLEEFDELLGIKELLYIPVRKLSLGERMKCEIVASLLHNPSVLFLDEPTIGLDVVAKKQIQDFLKRLNSIDGTTIFLTTHNMDDIETLCDHIAILDKGSLVYDGNLSNILDLENYKYVKFKLDSSLDFSKDLLHSFENNEYIYKIPKNQVRSFIKVVVNDHDIYDIEVTSCDLEDIITRIYKGEIVL